MLYIANYHTHHPFCRHAVGSVNDYVEKALDVNLRHIGFSDHAPSHLFDDGLRMSFEEFNQYLKEIEAAQGIYRDQIKILKGLEAEYLELDDDYYKGLLKKVQYLILGQHYIGRDAQQFQSSYTLSTKKAILTYKEEVVAAIESGFFKIIAHPDLFLYAYPSFDETASYVSTEIIEAAIKHNVIIEYNANGLRKGTKKFPEGIRHYYPRKEFWEIVKKYPNAKVIISADAHRPEQIYDEAIIESFQNLKDLKIKPLGTMFFE